MKKLILTLAMLGLSACHLAPPRLMVQNDCPGSWMKVHDGEGHRLAEHLPAGDPIPVDLSWYAGGQIYLLASAFSILDNHPLGSATYQVSVPYGNQGIATGPRQVPPWQVSYLTSVIDTKACKRP